MRWALLFALGCSPPPEPTAAASSAAAGTPVVLLALGDSFTAGTGSSPAQSFPARVADRMRSNGRAVSLQNLAVNGFTTDDVLESELPAISTKPTRVTLAIGANDIVHGSSADRYRSQVKKILLVLRNQGVDPRVVVALPQPDWSMSPVARELGDPAALHARIETFNGILRTEVESAGGRYLDLFPLMREQAAQGLIAPDELHPSAAAYDAWAQRLYDEHALD